MRWSAATLSLFVLASVCLSAVPAACSQVPANEAKVEELHEEAQRAEAQGDLATAAEKYEAILKLDPKLAPAYNNLGAVYFKAHEFGKAAAVLEKGLKVNPKMPSASALLGMSLYQMGNFGQARMPLEETVRVNPRDTRARLVLVNDLTKLGDFEAAAVELQKLSAAEPNDQHVLYLLGRVYSQLAQQALAKMNAIDPNSVWAHEISGEIMEDMKNYDGAVIEYKKAVDAAPRQPGTHYKLGDLYWSLSQWNNAAEQFQAELDNDPGNCMARWKTGDILFQQGIEPEKALEAVDKSLAMCPNLAEARFDRGRLLLRLHRNDEALADLQAAAKSTPNNPAVHFSLAQAYRALGQAQQAQSEMQLFSKLDASARAAAADQAQQAIKNQETAH